MKGSARVHMSWKRRQHDKYFPDLNKCDSTTTFGLCQPSRVERFYI